MCCYSFAGKRIEQHIRQRIRKQARDVPHFLIRDCWYYLCMSENNKIILYQTESDEPKIEVRLQNDTVWLTQSQMSELFQKAQSTINEHIRNIYKEGELVETDTMRKFGNSEKSTKPTNFYNLDVIISVGYRVKSHRGTQFRIWATKRLREYLVKGFTMNDDRLADGQSNYFDELVERVRKIRTSEANFYKKVTDIFATSIDYSSNTGVAKQFFATVQNKFHYAIHGKTAAELITSRVDSEKPAMGLTNWKGEVLTAKDAKIAKNYLEELEIRRLELLVEQFLSFAELRSIEQNPMYMDDWITKLDLFLELNDKEKLQGKGKVSKRDMEARVRDELKRYKDSNARNQLPPSKDT